MSTEAKFFMIIAYNKWRDQGINTSILNKLRIYNTVYINRKNFEFISIKKNLKL